MAKRPPSRVTSSPMSVMMPVNMAEEYHVGGGWSRSPALRQARTCAASPQVPGVVCGLADGADLQCRAHVRLDLPLRPCLGVHVHVGRFARDQRLRLASAA